MVEKLLIQNFLLFQGYEPFEIDFCDGVNVLIGGNGTGKTTVLKVLYGLLVGKNKKEKNFFKVTPIENLVKNFNSPCLNLELSQEFQIVYNNEMYRYIVKELCNELDKNTEILKELLEKYNNVSNIPIDNLSAAKEELLIGKSIIDSQKVDVLDFTKNIIFIPTTEMLSHSKGFLALNEKFKLPFDKTQIDILVNAEIPKLKVLSDWQKDLLKRISEIIGRYTVYENDEFAVVKQDGNKIAFSLEAEGYRKFALLFRLIENGTVEEGGILCWDEPESNINPELMPQLVEILIELQRRGVQIFIATHNANLAQYFDVKRNKADKILFNSLNIEGGVIQTSKSDTYRYLENSVLEKADRRLFSDIVNKENDGE
jgi:ABC-type multidrug transport system ATPase subunit